MLQQQQQQQSEPWIEILEEPKPSAMRFRYQCEGRNAGTILGKCATPAKRTYPTIKIHNMGEQRAAVVVVSCVTKDEPHYPHPHGLVGLHCNNSVCTLKIRGIDTVSMVNVGIQCSKRQHVAAAIELRTKIRVDPFATGYVNDLETIDLGAVRLCFQAFLPDASGKYTRIVRPVLSQPVLDKKLVKSLAICRLSKRASGVQGGEEVILLCDKVKKDDVEVRFFEEDEYGEVTWEAFGQFVYADVHHQCAIPFKTPAYAKKHIDKPVTVLVQLRRPSDEQIGEPKEFIYIPECPGKKEHDVRKRRAVKRAAVESDASESASAVNDGLSSEHPQLPQPNYSPDVPITVSRYTAADESNTLVSPDHRCTTALPSSTPKIKHQQQLTSGTILRTAGTADVSTDGQQVAQYMYIDNSSRVFLQQNANSEFVLLPGYQLVMMEDGSTVLEYDPNLANAVDVLDNHEPCDYVELSQVEER